MVSLGLHELRSFALGALLALSLPSVAQGLISRWTSSGLAGYNITSLAIDSDTRRPAPVIYAGTASAGVFWASDGSATWTPINAGLTDLHITALATYIHPQAALCPQCPLPPEVFLGTSSAGIFRRVESSWVTANNGLTHLSVTSLSAVPERGTLYAGTDGGGVFRSLDLGMTWVPVNTGLSSLRVRAVAAVPTSPSVAFAGTVDGTFKTTDGGASWIRVPVDSIFYRFDAMAFAISSAASWTALLTASLQCVAPCGAPPIPAVYRSVDSGVTWALVGDLANKFIQALAVTPAGTSPTFFAGSGGGGVFESSNGGLTWTAVNTGLGSLFVSALGVDPLGRVPIHAATSSAGVYRAVSETACTPTPTSLCLASNRFRVGVSWRDPSGATRAGQAIALTANTGSFWFFDPTNLELVVKILDGRPVNGKFWAFLAALTDLEFTLTVTDTETGAVKTYFNSQGQLASLADTSAFP